MNLETSPEMTGLTFGNRGLNFRPRSDFENEGEYSRQFLWLARTKLTKKLFFELPAGAYLVSNVAAFEGEVVPLDGRAAQWKSIYPGARQRLCEIFRNRAHYEALMEQGHKIGEENKKKEMESNRGKKPSDQSGNVGQSASLTLMEVMGFSLHPVPESTPAIKLVFQQLEGVPESECVQEISRLALEAIKAYEISGKVEFLTGKTPDEEFVLYAGFEPFDLLPDTARVFNARLSHRIPVQAHKGGKVKLNAPRRITEELRMLRGKYTDQGRFIFTNGNLIGRAAPADSWIAKAIGIEKPAEADFDKHL